MPFPNQVGVQPALAVAGDFASTNPRQTVLAGAGGLIAGPGGVVVGRFAWVSDQTIDDAGAPATVNNTGTGMPTGFVHREQQGLITTYLAEAGMVVPQGFPITLFNGGDFFVRNDGATQATPGMYAFANFADGRATFGNGTQANVGVGNNGSSVTVTGSIGPQTATFSGSVSGNTLTVSGTVTGTIVVGGTLSGGTGVLAGTFIVSQLTGTPGGVGTYSLSNSGLTVGLALLTESYGLLTVASVASGTLGVGETLTGTATGNIAGMYISALGTGVGGTGTYFVNATTTMALGSTITGQSNVQTKFICTSNGAAGELVKITNAIFG